MALNTIEEHRKVARIDLQTRVQIDLAVPRAYLPRVHQGRQGARHTELLHPQRRVEANSVNLSEGGMCVRLQESLELHSRVRLRLFPEPATKPLECAGRIAWVVQRLDLRDSAPFLYDVGVEFVDPSTRFLQFASRVGIALKPSSGRTFYPILSAATINGRYYVPRLEKQSSTGSYWHLVVHVDGVPCFSRRYPSRREALESWQQFKRQAALPAPRMAQAKR